MYKRQLQVHPVDDDGAAPEAAHKTLEPATIREDYAKDVQYYKDLLAHQETGLLCCRSSLIINPKGRYMHCWDMVALVALLLTAVATPVAACVCGGVTDAPPLATACAYACAASATRTPTARTATTAGPHIGRPQPATSATRRRPSAHLHTEESGRGTTPRTSTETSPRA